MAYENEVWLRATPQIQEELNRNVRAPFAVFLPQDAPVPPLCVEPAHGAVNFTVRFETMEEYMC